MYNDFLSDLFKPTINNDVYYVLQNTQAGNLAYYLTNAQRNVEGITIDNTFVNYLLSNNYNNYYDNFYYCGVFDNSMIFLNLHDISNHNVFVPFVYYLNINDHSIISYNFNGNGYVSQAGNNYLDYLKDKKCYKLFDSNYDFTSDFSSRVRVVDNNLDKFLYSKNPSEYIIGMLYFAIPILLFVFGLKVFKKGLFR